MRKPAFAFIPGESFNGAVARWADQVGGLERMSELTAVAGVTYGHRQNAASASSEQIGALAAAMQVDPRELIVRAAPRVDPEPTSRYDRHLLHGVSIPNYLLEKNVRRYSPAAFEMSLRDKDVGVAYHRGVWQVRAFPYSTESWETLLDRCPSCGKRPGWQHTLGIDFCEGCMADLKTAEAEVVPRNIRAPLAAAVGLVDHHPSRRAASLSLLPAPISDLGATFALELLVNLLPVADPGIPTNPIGLPGVPSLQLCRAVALSWEVMIAWPDGMSALASDRIATRLARHTDGNGGRTLRFLNQRRNTGISEQLSALIAEWRDGIDMDGPNREAILDRTRSITQAALLTGLGSAIVADLRRQRAIPTTFVLDGARPQPRFPAHVFDEFSELMKTRIPLERARLPIGVTCNGVEQLVAVRLLDQEEQAFIKARYQGMQIVEASIRRLENMVVAGATGDPAICMLPLHSAMKAVGGRLKPWGPVFRALVDGTLPDSERLPYVLATGKEALSRRILVPADAVPRIRSMYFDPRAPENRQIVYADTMSKIDGGETLNLGFSQSIPLLSAIRTKTGTREKLVPVAYVLDLAMKHISTSELAARRGVTKQRAYWDAVAKKVPDLGHGGFCRATAEADFFGRGDNGDPFGENAGTPDPGTYPGRNTGPV